MPDPIDLIYSRAEALYDARRYTMALPEFQKALALAPEDAFIHLKIAMCLMNIPGRDKDALEAVKRSIELNADEAHAHYIHAFMLRRLDKPKEAVVAAKLAVELAPDVGAYHSELGECYSDLKDYDKACTESYIAVGIEPNDAYVWRNHARILSAAKRTKQAHDALDKALELEPEDIEAHGIKGFMLIEEGKFGDAVRYFREALRLNPQAKWAREGYMNALRGRNPTYKILVWCSNMRAPFAYFGHPVVVLLLIMVGIIVACTTVLVSAISPHLLNVMLAFDPEGQHALDRQEKHRAKILGGYVLGSLLLGLVLLFTKGITVQFVFFFSLIYLAPILVTRIFELPEATSYRRDAIVYAAVGLLFGVGAVATSFALSIEPWDNLNPSWELGDTSFLLLFVFLCMCLFSRRLHMKETSFV